MKTVLIWFRNDLRIHDQILIHKALAGNPDRIIPFYCLDERQFKTTSFGFPKTGKFRARFLLESLADLRNSLQKLGSNLIIRRGIPEEIIPEIVYRNQVAIVYYSEEATAEEKSVETKLTKRLKKMNVEVESYWQATLYHPEDLPFPVGEIPDLFTNFRKEVEKKSEVKPCYPSPERLPPTPEMEIGEIPTLTELGLEEFTPSPKAVLNFRGGETEGLKRLKHYFWEKDCLKDYKQTRNRMLGADYSSKFSPWLALGCLSPRYVYWQVKKYEEERVKNDSTYWLVFELLWRDFFRFTAVKYGNRIFYLSGIQNLSLPWEEDWEKFVAWCEGQTGYPLVDANMRELKETGFMSNRGRQNVASFLTKNLGINWQMGAEWFESLLIDYDVCSNWGNWNYTAGVGNDARGFRYFNIPKQSKDYDYNGDYLRHWLPEIAAIKGEKIHEPWKLSAEEQKRYGVKLGLDYPRPVVDFFESIKRNERIYRQAKK
ncbi:MAG: DASH family cryptochrome [Geminocystis sp.]|nr:DASH family cryptochrome [Geminocystis sp.]HIK37860.1 DASH family cryptochrome [Geminocystis sp. M7585_C2015_104]MCS7146960.1 DASH family cryptochrome [Geminocystis sp.]MCX8077272.1 DASH family cryptochrome [Geminocystis sp.]MDW8115784.1 DASH family cryptochrome [Geminocystis sp.]